MLWLTSPVLCECDIPVELEFVVVIGPNLLEDDEDEEVVDDFRELYSRCSEYCCPDVDVDDVDDCCCCCCCDCDCTGWWWCTCTEVAASKSLVEDVNPEQGGGKGSLATLLSCVQLLCGLASTFGL